MSGKTPGKLELEGYEYGYRGELWSEFEVVYQSFLSPFSVRFQSVLSSLWVRVELIDGLRLSPGFV